MTFSVDQLNPDQLEEAAELWSYLQKSETYIEKDNKKSEKPVFIKIKETLWNGTISETYIKKSCIEAVGYDRKNKDMMQIHVTSGKEFKFNMDTFAEIWPLINKED